MSDDPSAPGDEDRPAGDGGTDGTAVEETTETDCESGARQDADAPLSTAGASGRRWGPLGRLYPEERAAGIVVVIAALLLGAAVVGGYLDLTYLLFLLTLGGSYVLLSQGLNVQWGYTGLINFSVAAFFGIGAYGVALATSTASPIAGDLSPVVGLLIGMAAAGVLALLIGLPTLSLRDDYLAIATLGLAEVVRLILKTESQWTNGTAGLYGVPALYEDWPLLRRASEGTLIGGPEFLGPILEQRIVDLGLVVVAVVGVWLLLRRVHRSPWGRTQQLIRTDEDLAEALGKDTYRLRLQSFVIGSLIMALAGGLFASARGITTPGRLLPIYTFYAWIAVIIGGTGSDRGAILGGLLIVAIREGTRFLSEPSLSVDLGGFELAFSLDIGVGPIRLFMIGTLILLVIHFRPQGVLPPRRELIWADTAEHDRDRRTSGGTTTAAAGSDTSTDGGGPAAESDPSNKRK